MDITIIGSGNVGSHLYKIFNEKKIKVSQIWSRNIENTSILNSQLATDSLDFSKSTSNIFIVAVKDDAILNVLEEIKTPANAVLVHTSGSVGMEILEKHEIKYGIFYPLQTFSKNRDINFSSIPILIEASDKSTLIAIQTLAQMISNTVHHCDSITRQRIHLSAVFACNFTNALLGVANNLLEKKQLNLLLLKPLIEETIQKSFELGPSKAQTGPAIRNDYETIDKHLDTLKNEPVLKKLYQLMTDMIMNS